MRNFAGTEAWGLCRPRIYEGRNVLEMRGIAGGQCGVLGQYDTGDHGVPQVARPASFLPGRHKIRRLLCGSIVERSDPLTDLFQEHVKSLHEKRAPFPRSHDLQSKTDF